MIEAKDFSYLIGNTEGLSDKQIELHIGLYNGYVSTANKLLEKLESVDKTTANHNYSEHRELAVEYTHNHNGVVLHELYFEGLATEYTEPCEALVEAFNKDFGSFEKFKEDLKATAMSARLGWAITAYNYRTGKIQNFAIDTHVINMPIYIKPLLVIDVWEHAFMKDYDTKKAVYIDNILEIINWKFVCDRYNTIK